MREPVLVHGGELDYNLEDTFPVMGTNSQNILGNGILYSLKIGERIHLCRWYAQNIFHHLSFYVYTGCKRNRNPREEFISIQLDGGNPS